MKRLMKLTVLSLVAMIAVAGCNEKETQKVEATRPQRVQPPSVVVVPKSVQGKWKAVKISVINKNTGSQKIYTVAIGSRFKLPESNMTLTVENFLPHFVMEGTTLTSQSNELLNPAVQLRVDEGGREIYKGWLFTLYPTTHAFQHPLFSFTLAGFIPAS